jgi:hypothetical protein
MPDSDTPQPGMPGSGTPGSGTPEAPRATSIERVNSIGPQRPIEPVGDDFPIDDAEAPAAKTKITARGAAIVGVRVVAGTIGLAVALAAIAGATFLPIPSYTATPATVEVTPVPTAQQLVCPGALLRLGDETGQSATTASSLGAPSIRSGASAGEVTTTELQQSDAATGATSSAPTLVGSADGDADGDDVIVGASESQRLDDGDFAGLATAACAPVASETWLVGGSTAVGRTTLITLANPSDVISTVSLAISAETGGISAPGVTGIVVQPHGQRVLPLAGFAPGVESPVVHVTSRGGQIVANLQQSTVRGIEAGGVDFVGASRAPSTTQVIPGVRISNSGGVQTELGEEGYADLATVLRIFVPGTDQASAEVTVTSDDGTATGTSFSVELAAGEVDDLALDDLVDGTYTVQVSSTKPVVAGARVSTVAASAAEGESPATDFAWLSSAGLLDGRALVAIASGAGAGASLHFANPTDTDTQVTLTAENGNNLSVTVPANGSAATGVDGTTYTLSDFDQLYAAVSYTTDGAISGFGVQAPAASAGPITIVP